MSRRILLPDNGQRRKDPKRVQAAHKAHATMAAQRPARLAAEIERTIAQAERARDRMTYAFNRWQRLEKRLETLRRRAAE